MAKKKGSGRKKGGSKKSPKKLSKKLNAMFAKAKSFVKNLPMPVKLAGGAVLAIFAWNRIAQVRAASFPGGGSSTQPELTKPKDLPTNFKLRGLTGLGVFGGP